MTLKELKVGQRGLVTSVKGQGALRQHILDMGMIPGTEVKVEKLAPLGDPMELRVRDYQLTIRLADAQTHNAGLSEVLLAKWLNVQGF